jgi:hypothetical protein
MELKERWLSKTPKFWKKVQRVGLVAGALGAGLAPTNGGSGGAGGGGSYNGAGGTGGGGGDGIVIITAW